MPTDVERLFRTIAPALVLLAGCDAKEAEPKADAVAKTPANVVDEPAVANAPVDEPEPEPEPDLEKPLVDVGEIVAPKLDVPAEVVAPEPEPVAEAKLPKDPTPKPKAVPDSVPKRRARASCPSGTWCTDKASAKEHAVPGSKYSMGCAENITRGAKGIDGPLLGSELSGFSRAQTKATRAEGNKNACCYAWFTRCPGGRPLLDDAGSPVVASFEAGLEPRWACERARLPASPAARAFAARAWLEDAAMEHASVASFGRVALELLSLGAPPELVEGAHLAALDEIRHARVCLSFARACGADDLEPGRLAAVPQRSADFARFAADTFIEGCVGESLAALVVTRAAAGAEDQELRAALEGIGADEARHAALAWKMVSWAVERGGAHVLAAVHEAADRLRPEASEGASAGLEPDGIDRLGRLGGQELARARRDGWLGIIDPMLRALQGPSIAA